MDVYVYVFLTMLEKKVNIETDKMNGRTKLVCSLRSLGNSIPSEILNDELERVTLNTEKYGNV